LMFMVSSKFKWNRYEISMMFGGKNEKKNYSEGKNYKLNVLGV